MTSSQMLTRSLSLCLDAASAAIVVIFRSQLHLTQNNLMTQDDLMTISIKRHNAATRHSPVSTYGLPFLPCSLALLIHALPKELVTKTATSGTKMDARSRQRSIEPEPH